jgi:hypothetical protein
MMRINIVASARRCQDADSQTRLRAYRQTVKNSFAIGPRGSYRAKATVLMKLRSAGCYRITKGAVFSGPIE